MSDRDEIAEVLARYAWALVDRDWSSYLTCFTPDAALDFSATGGPRGTPAQAVEALTTLMAGFSVTFNTIANVQITVDGDTGTSRTGFTMLLKIDGDPPTYLEVRGWYDDEHVHGPDGWRIARRSETLVDMH